MKFIHIAILCLFIAAGAYAQGDVPPAPSIEEALSQLRLAFEKHDPDFLLFYTDPVFNDIRTDRRFDELIRMLYPN